MRNGKQSSTKECDHLFRREEWIASHHNDYGEYVEGHWEYTMVSAFKDIDIGRFQCSKCGEIGYYTGLWREHHEKGRTLLDERTGNMK